MLRELNPTRQIPHEPIRKWFMGDALDLIVWFAQDDEIIGFQLCYSKGSDEHALTWWKRKGFSHDKIDDGEGRLDNQKMTPILEPDGTFDKEMLVALFQEKSTELDSGLVQFVTRKLEEYPRVDG